MIAIQELTGDFGRDESSCLQDGGSLLQTGEGDKAMMSQRDE